MQDFRVCLRGLGRKGRPIAWRLALSVVIGVARVALSLAFVWISKRVVDSATGAVDYPLQTAVIIMSCVMACQILCTVAQYWWEGRTNIIAQNLLRRNTYAAVMRSTWDGKERFHSGDTVNRLELDIITVVDFLSSTISNFLVAVLQFAAACVFLYILSPKLTLILVVIMPVAVVGSRMFFRKLRAMTGEIRAVDSRIQGHMQETLLHRVLVRTMGATSHMLERLDILQTDSYDKTCRRLNYAAFSRFFMNAGFTCGYALTFFWGAYGLRDGTVTYGLMVAFLQLVNQVQRPVADIARYIPSFIRALSSEERLMELENLPQEEDGNDILLQGVPGIRLENVSYAYPGAAGLVLRGLSFDFKPGTMTVITGPTGAGKSSMLRIILALLRPESGRVILYDGQREVASGVDTRINFMYVPQGNTLLSGTIRENLNLACPGADEARMKEALHLAAADFVMDLPQGLDTVVAEIGSGLSEGQAQRISIARALLHPGGILILDEATSALDADTEATLLSNISKYYHGGKTIICVTHRPAATSYADAELKIS